MPSDPGQIFRIVPGATLTITAGSIAVRSPPISISPEPERGR
jgi:hypothetical protein